MPAPHHFSRGVSSHMLINRKLERISKQLQLSKTLIVNTILHHLEEISFARLHGILMISVFFNMLVSFIIFAVLLTVRYNTVDILEYLLVPRVQNILYITRLESDRLGTRRTLYEPPVLEEGDSRKYEAKHVNIGRWVRMMTDLALTVVILLWTSFIAGMITLYHKVAPVVTSFLIIDVLAMLCEIFFARILLSHSDTLHEGLKNDLKDIAGLEYSYYTDDMLSRVFNSIMIVGECCGISGPEDFKRFRNLTGDFPPACCISNAWSLPDPKRPNELKCVVLGHGESNLMYHNSGCFDLYSQWFIDDTWIFITAITTFLCVEQLIQICVAAIILNYYTEETYPNVVYYQRYTVDSQDSTQFIPVKVY